MSFLRVRRLTAIIHFTNSLFILRVVYLIQPYAIYAKHLGTLCYDVCPTRLRTQFPGPVLRAVSDVCPGPMPHNQCQSTQLWVLQHLWLVNEISLPAHHRVPNWPEPGQRGAVGVCLTQIDQHATELTQCYNLHVMYLVFSLQYKDVLFSTNDLSN